MKRLLAIMSAVLIFATASFAQDKTKQPATTTPASTNPTEGTGKTAPAQTQEPAKGGQTAQTAVPDLSVAEIMKRNRAAMGSSMAAAKITSTVATGTVSVSGLSGPVEVYSKAPNRQATYTTLTGFGSFAEGYDGTVAWSQDPLNGLRIKSGPELESAQSNSLFDRDAQLEKLYPTIVRRGVEKVEDRDAYVLVATGTDGRSETWYLDAKTFLMVRQDSVEETPQGKFPVQSYLSDYRMVDGVNIPFKLRSVTSAQTIVLQLSEVKTNVAIDDSKFAKPAQ